MKTEIPKQFLPLNGIPLISYSIEAFSSVSAINEIVIVCDPQYRSIISEHHSIVFAAPGERRQDSLYNGIHAATSEPTMFCVHDAARPFLTPEMITRVINAAQRCGAAAAALPITYTVKEASVDGKVHRTLDRSMLWEVQTPQAVHAEILNNAFTKTIEEGIAVTDDVALAELVGCEVQLVQGSRENIKITTPEDLLLAKYYLEHGTQAHIQAYHRL